MSLSKDTRIAILGAGPIGVEAAVYALSKGYDVTVYEAERPGHSVARWGHVPLFSPWSMNRSRWGEAALAEAGRPLADADAYPTGAEYLDAYLRPLCEEVLGERLSPRTRVLGVSRRDVLKGEAIGQPARGEGPFLLLVEDADGRRYAEADLVIDTTGVYDQPRDFGPGGLPVPGQEMVAARIEHYVPDVLGADRDAYAGKRTMVTGAGYSAVTTVALLAELAEQASGTQVLWLLRSDEPPFAPIPDDPLAERARLAELGNRAAGGGVGHVQPVWGHLERLAADADALVATVVQADGARTLTVDRLVANVGYRPNTELFRELQVHQCYASEGPMKLAAYLLSQSADASGDCLAQTGGGFETMVSPEPDFYILGAKSYGRNSDFLLKLGFEQIETLFEGLDY